MTLRETGTGSLLRNTIPLRPSVPAKFEPERAPVEKQIIRDADGRIASVIERRGDRMLVHTVERDESGRVVAIKEGPVEAIKEAPVATRKEAAVETRPKPAKPAPVVDTRTAAAIARASAKLDRLVLAMGQHLDAIEDRLDREEHAVTEEP